MQNGDAWLLPLLSRGMHLELVQKYHHVSSLQRHDHYEPWDGEDKGDLAIGKAAEHGQRSYCDSQQEYKWVAVVCVFV